jgi:integrase
MKKRATTTSAIEWNTMLGLCSRLKEDKHFRDYLLIFCGSFWGLRISDLLSIRFCDVVNKSEMILVEKKTGKTRIITINPKVATAINLCIKQLQLKNKYREDGYMFANRWGGKLSISYINRRLKIIL